MEGLILIVLVVGVGVGFYFAFKHTNGSGISEPANVQEYSIFLEEVKTVLSGCKTRDERDKYLRSIKSRVKMYSGEDGFLVKYRSILRKYL